MDRRIAVMHRHAQYAVCSPTDAIPPRIFLVSAPRQTLPGEAIPPTDAEPEMSWIPYLKNLKSKPEVAKIMIQTGLSLPEVIFYLLEFWSWTDEHSVDGFLANLTVEELCVICPHPCGHNADKCPQDVRKTSAPCPCFFRTLSAVGWLHTGQDGVSVPNFARWMDNSAKRRLSDTRRKRKNRKSAPEDGQDVRGVSATCPQNVRNDADKMRTTLHNTKNKKENPHPPLPNEIKTETQSGTPEPKTPQINTSPKDLSGDSDNSPPVSRKEIPEAGRVKLRGLACDNPHMVPVVRAVTDHYERVVGTGAGRGSYFEAIASLLHAGHTQEQLQAAADHYAKHCNQLDTPPRYRRGVGGFYANDYDLYREGIPPERKKPSIHPKLPDIDLKKPGVRLRDVAPELFVDPSTEGGLPQ